MYFQVDAQITESEDTALHLAASQGDLISCNMLVQYGSATTIRAVNHRNRSSLDMARYAKNQTSEHQSVIDYLSGEVLKARAREKKYSDTTNPSKNAAHGYASYFGGASGSSYEDINYKSSPHTDTTRDDMDLGPKTDQQVTGMTTDQNSRISSPSRMVNKGSGNLLANLRVDVHANPKVKEKQLHLSNPTTASQEIASRNDLADEVEYDLVGLLFIFRNLMYF